MSKDTKTDFDLDLDLAELDEGVVEKFCDLIVELAKRSDERGVSLAQIVEELRSERPASKSPSKIRANRLH